MKTCTTLLHLERKKKIDNNLRFNLNEDFKCNLLIGKQIIKYKEL